MTQLRPFDILVIQTAIEEYKRKYPDRATPSAEVALAWRLGRRGRHKQQRRSAGERAPLRIYKGFRALRRLLLSAFRSGNSSQRLTIISKP